MTLLSTQLQMVFCPNHLRRDSQSFIRLSLAIIPFSGIQQF